MPASASCLSVSVNRKTRTIARQAEKDLTNCLSIILKLRRLYGSLSLSRGGRNGWAFLASEIWLDLKICRGLSLSPKNSRRRSSCLSNCSGSTQQVANCIHRLIITAYFSSILRCLGANLRWNGFCHCYFLWYHSRTTTSFCVRNFFLQYFLNDQFIQELSQKLLRDVFHNFGSGLWG